MKVYAHFLESKRDGYQYRWRTLLQFGGSWEVIGSVVMKNPGSSSPIAKEINEETLRQLSCFDNSRYAWHAFSVDNTMMLVERLFIIKNGGQALNGVIQIFNLFNIRNADLNQALKDGRCAKEAVYSTVEQDIEDMRKSPAPIYIGWGTLGSFPEFYHQAGRYFSFAKDEMRQDYLLEDFTKNSYYHPQYLMGRGKNRPRSKWLLKAFCLNSTDLDLEPVASPYVGSIDVNQIIETVKRQTDENKWYERRRFQFYDGLQATFDKSTINIRFVRRSENNSFTPNEYQRTSYRKAIEILANDFGYDNPEKAWIGRKRYCVFGTDTANISNNIMTELKSITSALDRNMILL